MDTIQSLFEKYGTPPPEICLDWAWQLEKIAHDSSTAISTAATTACLTWNEIGVDEAGQLMLLAPAAELSCNELTTQLLDWSLGLDACKREFEAQGNATSLEKRGLGELRQATSQWFDREENANIISAAPTVSSRAIVLRNQSKSVSKQRRVWVSRKLLIKSIAIAAVLGIIWLAIQYATETTSPLIATKQSFPSGSKNSNSLADTTASLESETPTTALDINKKLSLSTTETFASLAAESIANPTPSLDLLPSTGLGESLTSKVEPRARSAASSDGTVAGSKLGIAGGNTPLTTEKTVIEEIQALARKAEAGEREISVEASRAGDGATIGFFGTNSTGQTAIAPLVIDCESTRQVFKLRDEVALKPKEPVWRIRLEATEGFLVEPAGVQQLSPRDSVFWAVYDHEAKSPRTRIVVQAQQASGRKGDVLWRLHGSAEDLPTVALPLARQWLDPIRTRLKQFDLFIRVTQDQLQQQGRMPGMTSQTRSRISAQRRWADQQSKVLERSLIVIAETDRLVGLVDGRFEVHGQLQDGTEEHAPVLLNFGMIDAPVVDSKPTKEKPPKAPVKTQE